MLKTLLPKTLRLASVGERPTATPQAVRALLECPSGEQLALLAYEHRMAPWVAAVIAANPATASASHLAPVREAGTAQTLRTMLLFAEMTAILKLMNDARTAVVVLKGPALADTIYPDPGLRVYGDIDILIHETDLAVTSEMLRRRGYLEEHEDEGAHRLHQCHGIFQRRFRQPESGHVIEVHCDHLQIGLEPKSMDEIWSSAEEHSFGVATARVLERHDLFVQLCVHLFRHGFDRLAWFKDLDLLVRSGTLDWTRIEAKAREQGCRDSVSYSLRLLRKVLGTPLPAAAVALMNRQGRLSLAFHELVWDPKAVTGLAKRRKHRWRRLVQFAPETGMFRGGLPALLTSGRRVDKLRVLAAVPILRARNTISAVR
jgi:hypothetical protein